MKKLFTFALMGAFALGSLFSCSEGGDEGGNGNGNGNGNGKNSRITIVTSRMGDITQRGLEDPSSLGIMGNGTAVIDWGDGSQPETITLLPLREEIYHLDNISYNNNYYQFSNDSRSLVDTENYVHHFYSMPGQKTITITGDITGIHIGESSSSVIDVSRMPGLLYLWCIHENITSLDLSENTALKYLHCFSNQGLNTLELPQSSELKLITCGSNPNLRALDVSKNPALVVLECLDNNFSTLDMRECTALEVLNCGGVGGPITDLYLDGLTSLKFVDCSCNNITYLNLLGCSALKYLRYYNLYSRDGLEGRNRIHQIDGIEELAELHHIDCSLNDLSVDDISDLIDRVPVHSGEEDHLGHFVFGQGSGISYDEIMELRDELLSKNWDMYTHP